MYAKSTRPSAKRDDQIARPRRAQIFERSELRAKRPMRMCPRSGQIFYFYFVWKIWLTQLPEVDPAENLFTRYLHFQEPESKNSAILLNICNVG